MITKRALLFALIVIGCLAGVGLRIAAPNSTPTSLDYLARANVAGKQAGPFTVEASGNDGPLTLRLRSTQCGGLIDVAAARVDSAPREQFITASYPSPAWRAVHVYDGRAYDDFVRLAPYVHFLARRLVAELTLSPIDVTDLAVFTFYSPADCPLDRPSLVAAAKALIALAPRQGNR